MVVLTYGYFSRNENWYSVSDYLFAIFVSKISDGVIEQWTSLGKEFGLLDFHHEISQSSDDDESDNGSDIDDNDDSDDDGVINNNHENDLNEHADHDRNE